MSWNENPFLYNFDKSKDFIKKQFYLPLSVAASESRKNEDQFNFFGSYDIHLESKIDITIYPLSYTQNVS